jgi:CHAT domain-containing protein/tetratricopeptide (TPR) repeat protein
LTERDGHPDSGLIAAHAERRLSPAEAARMDEHLAGCSACCEVFAETVRFALEERIDEPIAAARPVVARFPRRPAVRLAAALALAAGLVLASWQAWRAHSRPIAQSLVTELATAMGEQRFVEPRLTGGFHYGRFVRLRSGEAPQGLDAQTPAVIAAVARIRERAERDTSPEALGALGITYLVSGDVNAAVKALESAAAQAPENARLQSDLAAAYLVRASRLDEAADIPRGLEAAEKSIALAGAPDEAWFNRALALEGLHLVDEARKAWQEYLKRDATSHWAEEARKHLVDLPSTRQSSVEEDRVRVRTALDEGPGSLDRLADTAPQIVREYFENELLGAWAEARLASRGDERVLRERAGRVGGALRRTTGDALPRDAARALDAPPSVTCHDPPGSQALGYRALAEAQRHYEVQEPSCDTFREAHRLLSLGGSPYAEWARERVVTTCLYRTQPQPALAELARLESVADRRGYVMLLGRVRWMQGLIGVRQGDLTASLERYRLARASFVELGDVESEAFLLGATAENLNALGEQSLSWRERSAALRRLGRVRDPRRLHGILLETALACLDANLLRTALHLHTALVRQDEIAANPTLLGDALTRRSSVLHALGADDLAAADLAEVRRSLPPIADAAVADALRAAVDETEGLLLAASRPQQAADALRRALGYFERTLPARVPGLRLVLARALAARGLDDAAEAELLAGIRLIEVQRVSLHDVALQASFFEQAVPLFDEMVELQVDKRRDPAGALSFVERGRGRQLIDALAVEPPSLPAGGAARSALRAPLGPEAMQRALPAGVALVYYVCRKDRLLAWLLTREDLRFVEQRVSEQSLARLVAAQQAALQRRAPLGAVREAGGLLYDVLLRPLAPALASARALVFLPDAALHSASFAALWDRQAGRFLAEDYLVGLSPSGSVLVGHARASAAIPRDPQATVVGDPLVDAGVRAGRAALPGAVREAAEIATLYENPSLLIGSAATKAAFFDALRSSDVVHYAGHAAAVPDDPASPRLLLAADPRTGDSGALYLRDLAGRTLHARVVVLAACRTAAGAVSRVEGALSLSRPFLAAGVPNVVGSLWDVDDEIGRTFFVTFHRALRAEGEPALALHEAQLSLLRSGDPTSAHPASWAGFVSIGSLALPDGQR